MTRLARHHIYLWLLVPIALGAALTPAAAKVATPAVKTRILQLGRSHGKPLTCRAVMASDVYGIVSITLQFVIQRGSQVTIKSTPEILSFPHLMEIDTEDFIHAGHKQVLVEGSYGANITYIYDYDGEKVRQIYARDEGRVGVEPAWSRRYGRQLAEYWGRSSFTDEFDLGVGYDMGMRGVVRYLHWNGKQFVPDQPGETQIIYRRKTHRHHRHATLPI